MGLLLLIAAGPVWFPWVLGPVARHYGLNYADYNRVSYTRFAVNAATFTNRTVEVRAARVEAFVPTVWLWQRYTARESPPYLQTTNWRLIYKRSQTDGKAKPPSSVYTNFQKFEAIMTALGQWIPSAALTNGAIEAAGETLEIPSATWGEGTLRANLHSPQQKQSGTLTANLGAAKPHEIQFASDSLDLRSTIRITNDATGLRIQSTHRWLTNDIEASARFGREGILPDKATLRAEAFAIPAERLKLPHYEHLTGSAALAWQDNQFTVKVTAEARPHQQEQLPPVSIRVESKGDIKGAEIESVHVTAPWLELQLAAPIKVQFTSPYLLDATTLRIFADLGQQAWFSAAGQLEGRALFQPMPSKFPAVSFALSGSGIAISNLQTRMLNLSGQFLWPWLELTNARVEFDDGTVAQSSAKLNVTNQVVHDGRVHFQGWLGRDWLPTGYSYENASLSAHFEGPLRALSHAGQLQLEELVTPQLKTLRLEAQWQGRRLHFQESKIHVASGKSALDFEGALQAEGSAKSFQVTALTLRRDGERALELASPFQLWLQQTNPLAKPDTRTLVLRMEPLHWTGDGREIHLEGDVTWPQQGHLNGSIKAIPFALFEDFVHLPTSQIIIQEMKLSAAWTNSPITGQLELAAEAVPTEGLPLRAELKLNGTSAGLAIEKLAVFSQTHLLAEAKGLLPLGIQPGVMANRIQFHETQPLQLEVMTQPTAFFWDEVAKWSGLRLRKPDLRMKIGGTWGSPQGQILLQAERIDFPRMTRQLPSVENLELSLGLDSQTAQLTNLHFLVQEQLVSLNGTMPLEKESWKLASKTHLPDWKKAAAHLQATNVDLASFGAFLPKFITPQGLIDLDLMLRPGGQFDGELHVQNVRTHPLEAVGPIQDIEARMKFTNRTARLEMAAEVGGQPVIATGHMDLPVENWRAGGGLPPFELNAQGTNLPLARKSELILRADLNLAIRSTSAEPALVLGTVRLRDSYYLSDLSALVPGKVAAPSRRPPYVSIQEDPFAQWRLDVTVQGDEFLRVRSPLFKGKVSANLKLGGTLKDPIALGEVKIDSGAVTFPFAQLDVKQGLVTLTSENPYRPELFITAGAKRVGYDIRMEITGPADEPVVQFSSSPPLSSEQIILMVTAGEMPQDAARLSTGQRAQRLALFLGKNVLSQFGVGGGQERLTIHAGEELTEQGAPTYEVEYKLSRKWSVVGQYDRFSAYNAGLKWRIYSK